MKKFAVLHPLAAWLILSVALMLFSCPAQAYVYDDFTSPVITAGLWSDVGPNIGLFSQPSGGPLYFSSTTSGQIDKLKSSAAVSGALFVAMQYSNFQATNTAQPYQSSGVHLFLSDGTNMVDADRLKNVNGSFFQGFSQIGGVQTYSDPIKLEANSGWLGIGYNGILGTGGQVTLWYDAGAGWQELAACAPNFDQNPYFLIMGKIQDGTSLSFQVNQVQLTPTPVPPSVLLLGSGLAGLAGWKRLKKG